MFFSGRDRNKLLIKMFRSSKKTTARENDLYKSTVRVARKSLRKNKISRHFHERRNGFENWTSRISCSGKQQQNQKNMLASIYAIIKYNTF